MAMRSFGAGSAGPRLIPSGIRPHLLAPRIISQRRSRISRALPRRSFETRAERRRPGDGGNFNFGGGGGNGGTQALDYALPAAGALALLAFGTPLLGGLASSLGVVLLITAGAGALGVIDRISAAFGVSPLTAAGGVVLSVLGVFLIPAFLKFGFLAFGGFLVYNALSGLLGGGFEAEPELDARDVTIDVEAETVDD